MSPEQLAIDAMRDAIGFMEQPENIVETLKLRGQLKGALLAMVDKHGADSAERRIPSAPVADRGDRVVPPVLMNG